MNIIEIHSSVANHLCVKYTIESIDLLVRKLQFSFPHSKRFKFKITKLHEREIESFYDGTYTIYIHGTWNIIRCSTISAASPIVAGKIYRDYSHFPYHNMHVCYVVHLYICIWKIVHKGTIKSMTMTVYLCIHTVLT